MDSAGFSALPLSFRKRKVRWRRAKEKLFLFPRKSDKAFEPAASCMPCTRSAVDLRAHSKILSANVLNHFAACVA